MVQIKKDDVRARILESARHELERRGYAATTMRGIARRAGTSPSNVYVYFPSKLALLFAIYGPWFKDQIIALEEEASGIRDPRARLRKIVATMWEYFPSADGGFGNTFIEGLAVSGRDDRYSRDLLLWAESKLSDLIVACLPEDRAEKFGDTALAHILFMAFDGFAVNYVLVGRSRRLDRCIDMMTDLILGDAAEPPKARKAS